MNIIIETKNFFIVPNTFLPKFRTEERYMLSFWREWKRERAIDTI
jgi:hypothetical protein